MSKKPAQDDLTYRNRLRVLILAAAEKTVADKGLGALQARSIAAAAACSVGTVYNIFGDLDGLITAVNDRTLEQLGEPLQDAFEANLKKPVAARLIALALAYKDFALAHSLRWRAIFEHHPQAPQASEQYRATQAKLLGLIEAIIAPEVPDAAARAHAARALFAGAHGIVALAIDGKLSAFDAAVVETEIRLLVAAASAGLARAAKEWPP